LLEFDRINGNRIMKTIAAWIIYLGALSATTAPGLTVRAGTTHRNWTIQNPAFIIHGTPSNIVVTTAKSGKTVFAAKRFAAAEFRLLRAQSGLPAEDRSTPFRVDHTFTVVSLFGNLLSLRDNTIIEQGSGALPGGNPRYWTLNLADPAAYNFDSENQLTVLATPAGPLVGLERFYLPSQIATALARVPFVRKYSKSPVDAKAAPRTILLHVSPPPDVSGRYFDVPHDVLTRFAIVGATASTVAIQLGLPGYGPCRTCLTVLRLDLPRNATIRSVAGTDATVLTPPPDAMPTTIGEGNSPPMSDGSQFSPVR
jgi:hypothetical protein